jgi:hypothetical protein
MSLDAVASIILKWRKDPIQFVTDNFDIVPDEWQKKALIAFASKDEKMKRISLRSCVGPGKSAVLAWCAWNFLSCYGARGDHPKGVAISVTWENLRDGLWAEMAKWQSRSDFLLKSFTWTKTRIYANDHPTTWFLAARSFNKSADNETQGRTLSGIHAGHVLFLIDESGMIPPSVLKAAEQAMSAEHFAKIVQAGNPTSTEGMLFAAATTLAEQWHNIKITSDPDDPDRTPRVPVEWAATQIKTYGRDDPWVRSAILGDFPEGGINTLLSLEDVEKAINRQPTPGTYEHVQKRLGVDVALYGSDSTVIFPRQGLASFTPAVMRGASPSEIAAKVATMKHNWGSEIEAIDNTGGFGSGVVDSLLMAGLSPIAIHFSEKASDSRFYNKRAEMWYLMAEWIKRGGCLPPSETLKKELLAPTYSFKNGRIIIEEKAQIKKRLGHSCDHSDALALTFSMPDMPATNPLIPKKQGALKDSDPFAT